MVLVDQNNSSVTKRNRRDEEQDGEERLIHHFLPNYMLGLANGYPEEK
jgi:hypothetical protein